jgi:hypothetical protein
MKVAYIAGPYRGQSKIKIINWLQRQANIRRAVKVAKWAWREGFAVICPHKNSGNFDGLVTDLMFLKGDKEILKRCDAMILVPGWQTSAGTREELKIAIDELTIYTICEYRPRQPLFCAGKGYWYNLLNGLEADNLGK